MNCRQCGVRLAPDDLVCGNCGTIVDTALQPTPSVAPPSTPRPARRASVISSATLLIVLVACGLLALFTTSVVGGIVVGLRDHDEDRQAEADKYYQEGLANLTAGKLQLAKADFEYVLKINLNYPGAREQLTRVQTLLTVKPTPTFAAIVSATQQLYQTGLDAYQKNNWKTAIEVLSQVRSIEPAYEKDNITQMVYTASMTYGLELLKEDRLEEAIAYFDQAAYLKPLPADVAAQAQYARMYISARDYWNVNWEKAIESFTELYKIGPSYRDTFPRLVEAYIQYGDERTRAGDPCVAQTQYDSALKLRPTAQLQTKADAAKEACLTAPPSITGTNQVLSGLFAGRIAYPVFDSSGSRVLAASAGDQKLYTAAIGDQPEWQRNGPKFVNRTASGINLLEGGNTRTIAPAGAEFPTLSPDGSRVIYSLQGKLYMINTAGSESPIDLGPGFAPTWAPNGLLAYAGCDAGGTCGILIRNPDTTEAPKRLTGNPNDIPTSWSPDGFNISYYSNIEGNYDLFFVNTAGGVQQVTKNAGNNIGGAWGPDGAHVAFLSDRDGTWSLYIAKYDGTEATKIAIAPQSDWTRQRVSWAP